MKRCLLMIVLLLDLLPTPVLAQDEFKEWVDSTSVPQPVSEAHAATAPKAPVTPPGATVHASPVHHSGNDNLYWLAGVVLATAAAGVLVRYRRGRYARPFFLVGSIVVLGFYRGSCPCPVGGFQEAVLFLAGAGGHFGWLWWFVALLPLTYLFGKVWCGWVCQLGALQELLYRPGVFNFFSSKPAQRILRFVRTGALVALLLQLVLTHNLWWKQVDPFKTAFNLATGHPFSWVLLGVLLVSSVLMFRPFCKTLCPVGLVLGWVSKLPGAAGIQAKESCIGCKSCSQACHIHALTRDQKTVELDPQECIACGQCLDSCPLHALDVQALKGTGSTRVLYSGKQKNRASSSG